MKYTQAEVVFGFCDQDKEVIDKPTPGLSQEGNWALIFEFHRGSQLQVPSLEGI
jgi:hypothetical protein